MDHDSNRPPPHPPFWRSRFGIGWIVLAAVAGWFLWAEHRAHLLGLLPFAFLLACPLMHVFMHRGHHHRGGPQPHRDDRNQGDLPGSARELPQVRHDAGASAART